MLFNSLTFLIFLPTVLALYYLLPFRGQNWMLLIASYLFYGWWDVRFLFLIVVSTVVDYGVALLMDRGVVTMGQRIRCGAAIIGSAIAFVVIPWHAVHITLWPMSLHIDWPDLFAVEPLGWWVLSVSVIAVALGNVLGWWMETMPEQRRRRFALICSMCGSLGLLGVFKYFNFFIDSAENLLRSVGYDPAFAHLDIVLPVGISFYTFQTMSYTIDVYRKIMPATPRLLDFALFVTYFPQLVAGPIERAEHLLPSVSKPRTINLDDVSRGCFLILLGMFQKVAIADGVAQSVNSVYNSAAPQSWLDVIGATGLFAVQIYCDFAGYSNIARGCSKLMGIELMVNFRLPFFSQNPSEFWHRWHISLSSWLRDYLYIPLGGNRKGPRKTYRNLMLTMLLGGLWHGAAWNFVLWGAYQGAILCGHRLIVKRRDIRHRAPVPLPTLEEALTSDPQPALDRASARVRMHGALATLIRIGVFFVITCYGWLLFRAGSVQQIAGFTRTLFTDVGNTELHMHRPTFAAALGLVVLVIFEIAQYATGDARVYQRWPAFVRGAFYALLLLLTIMGTSGEPSQFIYFQF